MSLTLLVVSLKQPVDLTANMWGLLESIARVSSLIFMSSAMVNFTTSLRSLDDNEMLLNLAALGIIRISIIGNISIHNIQLNYFGTSEVVATSFILISLVKFCSSALIVQTARSYIECKCREMHKIALDEEKVDEKKFPVDRLRLVVKNIG